MGSASPGAAALGAGIRGDAGDQGVEGRVAATIE
jgi:hypothetical protein